jgi:hypothetical protein
MTGVTSGVGTVYPSGEHGFTPFLMGFVLLFLFSFMCMFYRSLFVLLYFFFWPLWCLFFFDLRILITTLVPPYSSCHRYTAIILVDIGGHYRDAFVNIEPTILLTLPSFVICTHVTYYFSTRCWYIPQKLNRFSENPWLNRNCK